jgi:hypothetical protein
MDRLGPVKSQVAGLLQLPAHGQDLILDRGGGAGWMARGARAVVPIDAIEPLALSVLDPVIDGGGTHTEFPCDLALRSTVANGRDDRATVGSITIPFVMVNSWEGLRFLPMYAPDRSGCSVTQVFGMLCHLPDNVYSSKPLTRQDGTSLSRGESAVAHHAVIADPRLPGERPTLTQVLPEWCFAYSPSYGPSPLS